MTNEDRLYTLIAELTYLCPLRCVYCSNPTNLAAHPDRLSTADWLRVFKQAAELGALQLNLSGGEPLLRRDLEELVAGAHALDFYSNLITSGLPLTRERLRLLKAAGLSSVQVSIQDSLPAESDRIAGRSSFEQKLEVARWVKELDLPLTLNVVLHRQNLARIAEIIALAESLNVDRLELANTQYLAWALENRSALLPSQAQLDAAREIAKAAKERLKGKIEVLFVLPDYYSDRPKACMSGWGQALLARQSRWFGLAPATWRTPCPDSASTTCKSARSTRSGITPPPLLPSEAKLGCRAVPELRAARNRLWRMPLPGLSSDRRRSRYRPRVRPFAQARVDHRSARPGPGAAADPARSALSRNPALNEAICVTALVHGICTNSAR